MGVPRLGPLRFHDKLYLPALRGLRCWRFAKRVANGAWNIIDVTISKSYRIIILTAWLAFLYIFYLLIFDVSFPITKFQVVSYELQFVRSGAMINLKENVCSTDDVEAHVDSQFVDHLVYSSPREIYNLFEGCQTFSTSVYIPTNMAADTYDYIVTITAPVNPIKSASRTYPLLKVIVNSPTNITIQKIGPEVLTKPTENLYPTTLPKEDR